FLPSRPSDRGPSDPPKEPDRGRRVQREGFWLAAWLAFSSTHSWPRVSDVGSEKLFSPTTPK
ncbi:hypothetical protein KUCAC02_028651, partial [Chaenocephalus aceratus]